MSQRSEYPAGVPCWVDTEQRDPEAAAAFYSGLFGWTTADRTPAGSPQPYFVGQIDGGDVAGITSLMAEAPNAPAWNTYVAVASADEAAERARDAGGSVVMDPFDVGEAGRMAVLADREGAVICVWQAGASIGSERVNEHGSVNFNSLHTKDRESAVAFYGALFGWDAGPMDPSGEGAWMFRLPGYGDHLERDNPGWQAGMAELGAPDGFSDTVALLVPIGEDPEPGQVPHWGVTFAVDDADTAAETAASLGATVVVPPFDAPWVRMSIVRDPQGAVFTASQYVPPS
jgi:uncharacterized protein